MVDLPGKKKVNSEDWKKVEQVVTGVQDKVANEQLNALQGTWSRWHLHSIVAKRT